MQQFILYRQFIVNFFAEGILMFTSLLLDFLNLSLSSLLIGVENGGKLVEGNIRLR